MAERKRRLEYSPTGLTPQSKKTINPSGASIKLLGCALQEEIRSKFEEDASGKLWRTEVEQALSAKHHIVSISHAVNAVFKNSTYKRGVFTGFIYAGAAKRLAIPIEADELETEKVKAAQGPCNCVGNTLRVIQQELANLAKYGEKSVLRCPAKDLNKLTLDDFTRIFKDRTPVLYRVFNGSLERKSRTVSAKKRRGVIGVLCKLSNIHNRELNSYQKLMGLCLRTSGTSKSTIQKLSQLYDSVSYNTLTSILDQFSTTSKDLMKSWAQTPVIQAGDNLDIRAKVRYESQGVSYHDIHLYNNMVYKCRIDVTALSDVVPQVDMGAIDFSQFILNDEEENALAELMCHSIKKSWQNFISESITVEEPPHKYLAEMAIKTEKLHAGVIDKNESKAGEMLDILRYCSSYPTPEHAHKVPYRGDVGTYKIAKKALSISDTALPFVPCIGAFHLQMEWVQLIFDRFFDEECTRDPAGLAAMKVVLNCRQVQKNIRKNYYAANLFLDKVLDCLLLEAGSTKLIETDTNSTYDSAEVQEAAMALLGEIFASRRAIKLPAEHCPLCNKMFKSFKTLKDHISVKHPEQCIIEEHSNEKTDFVLKHTQQLLNVLLIKRCLDYAIKSGNGEHVSLLMKHMVIFYRQLGYRHYALACLEHVAMCQLFLSDRCKEMVMHECFVNNQGRRNTNMAMDLDLEHSNKFFKDNFTLKHHAPSKPVLERLSFAQDMVQKVTENFYKQFKIHKASATTAMNREKYESDIKTLHSYLKPRKLYTKDGNGRVLQSRKLMIASHDLLLLVDVFDLKQWFHNSLLRMCGQRFLKA